jgi:hypothetical protein
MIYHLVVAKPFLAFMRGDIIADATKISEVLGSEHEKFVTKVGSTNSSRG